MGKGSKPVNAYNEVPAHVMGDFLHKKYKSVEVTIMFLQQFFKYLLISIIFMCIDFQTAFCVENWEINLESILAKYDSYVENVIKVTNNVY